MPFFVDLILPLPIPNLFTYAITEEEYNFIQPGIRIVVFPLATKKNTLTLSYKTHRNIPAYEAKSIEYIIDQTPIVSQNKSSYGSGFQPITLVPLGVFIVLPCPVFFCLKVRQNFTFINFLHQTSS